NRDYYFAPGIYRELVRGTWEIVHVQGYHTLVAPLAMVAALGKRIPYVLTFHSGGHSSPLRNKIRGLQRAMLRPLIAGASQLIGVSQFEVDFFSETLNLPKQRFAVVPNGSDLPDTPILPATRRKNLLISIGRLERYKGHQRVIEAFPTVMQRYPE